MTDAIACPLPQEFLRLVLGQVLAPEADALEQHVAGCPRCSAAITELVAEGPLVDAMRARAAVAEEADRGLVGDLIGRLKALPPPSWCRRG
jgi:anti-sigma factor RsiW